MIEDAERNENEISGTCGKHGKYEKLIQSFVRETQ
jgi:hypothetical protein